MKLLLAVSSHVSHGYVGNRAMVFPLQFNGWDVDAINTTDYSNHPGYGKFQGRPTDPQLVRDLFRGLHDIVDYNEYEVIISGYSPNAAILTVVYEEISKVFAEGAQPLWIVDPVLGDNGKLYVNEDVVPVVKKILESGHVALTTPNQLEFELLTDTKLTSWDSVKQAFTTFHELYPVKQAVLTSVSVEGKVYIVGLSNNQVYALPVNEIACHFNGCGDVFAGLLAHAFHSNGGRLSVEVLADVTTRLHRILEHSLAEESASTKHPVTLVKDIRLVSSRHVLLDIIDSSALVAQAIYL